MERHDITVDSRHRAMPDAQVLRHFWAKLRAAWPRDELQAAMDRASLRATLPAALSPDLADDLPETAGVYRFYGQENAVESLLYIGKANNLRERVLDHFREGARTAKARELAAQVRRVEWTRTAGDLDAQLLEAHEIREKQPPFNRRLRGGAERLTWLFAAEGPPALVELEADVLRSGNAFGAYRTERAARRALESLAREHQWCFKLLGMESGSGSCVGFQMGRCKGACVGKESAALHGARVRLRLMPLMLEQWPHDGPVMVREGSGEHRRYHVLDGWQHLGSVEPGDDDGELEEILRLGRRSRRSAFDIDTYRILTRMLREPRYRPVRLPAAAQ
jgi:DNA polymerase-3 subunit epsilon